MVWWWLLVHDWVQFICCDIRRSLPSLDFLFQYLHRVWLEWTLRVHITPVSAFVLRRLLALWLMLKFGWVEWLKINIFCLHCRFIHQMNTIFLIFRRWFIDHLNITVVINILNFTGTNVNRLFWGVSRSQGRCFDLLLFIPNILLRFWYFRDVN